MRRQTADYQRVSRERLRGSRADRTGADATIRRADRAPADAMPSETAKRDRGRRGVPPARIVLTAEQAAEGFQRGIGPSRTPIIGKTFKV